MELELNCGLMFLFGKVEKLTFLFIQALIVKQFSYTLRRVSIHILMNITLVWLYKFRSEFSISLIRVRIKGIFSAVTVFSLFKNETTFLDCQTILHILCRLIVQRERIFKCEKQLFK